MLLNYIQESENHISEIKKSIKRTMEVELNISHNKFVE